MNSNSNCPPSANLGLRISCCIGQPLALDALKRGNRPRCIAVAIRHAVVIPELKFGQIAMQVRLATVLIDALHAALEDAERALNRVRVDDRVFPADIVALGMCRGAMAGKVQVHVAIVARIVGQQVCFRCDVGL